MCGETTNLCQKQFQSPHPTVWRQCSFPVGNEAIFNTKNMFQKLALVDWKKLNQSFASVVENFDLLPMDLHWHARTLSISVLRLICMTKTPLSQHPWVRERE